MLSDIRIAARTLLRAPLFAAIAVASLALGIGANTAIFSVLDRVLLRSMAVSDPASLVVLHTDSRGQGSSTSDSHESVFSVPVYRDIRDRATVFDGVIARAGRTISLTYGSQSERASAEIVSGNYFHVLGLQTFLGRVFTEAEDRNRGGHPVAVLTYTAWQHRFGANRGIVNQTIRINSHPFTVIGVLRPGFNGLLNGSIPDVIVPLAMSREATPGWDPFDDHEFSWLNVFARLKPGVTRAQAQAAASVVFRQIRESEVPIVFKNAPPKREGEEFVNARLELVPAGKGINDMERDWRTPLFAVMAMVGLVLLIACANVANLMIVRAARRQKEIAIRISLGASRGRMIRQLFIESALIAVAAGAFAMLTAAWVISGLAHLLPNDLLSPGYLDFTLDRRVLLFTAAISVATSLVFGLLPAWQASRQEINTTLKAQSSAVTASGHARTRKAMVLVQVAFATLLIILAGLFARSSSNLLMVEPGFRAENVLTFGMDPRLNGYSAARGQALYSEMLLRLRNMPSVASVAAANPGPLTNNGRYGNVTVEGYRAGEGEYVGSAIRGVTPGYFAALRIPVLAGHEFTAKDTQDAPKVAIVNEAFAKKYFANTNPIGRKMRFGASNKPPDVEIVGLVHNYKHGNLREEIEPAAFMPIAQDKFEAVTFYVRTTRADARLPQLVRDAVRNIDASVSVFDMKAMSAGVEESAFRERLVSSLAITFGLLATLLAALGVYGVIAYTVARRTNEFGIRVALGASRRGIVLLVLNEVAGIALAGVIAGVILALAAGRTLQSELYGVEANDPVVFAFAAFAIAFIAFTAATLPARRAASVTPSSALRYE